MTSAAVQYRQLARDFHLMARNLPPGEERSALLKMAEVGHNAGYSRRLATVSLLGWWRRRQKSPELPAAQSHLR